MEIAKNDNYELVKNQTQSSPVQARYGEIEFLEQDLDTRKVFS